MTVKIMMGGRGNRIRWGPSVPT